MWSVTGRGNSIERFCRNWVETRDVLDTDIRDLITDSLDFVPERLESSAWSCINCVAVSLLVSSFYTFLILLGLSACNNCVIDLLFAENCWIENAWVGFVNSMNFVFRKSCVYFLCFVFFLSVRNNVATLFLEYVQIFGVLKNIVEKKQ